MQDILREFLQSPSPSCFRDPWFISVWIIFFLTATSTGLESLPRPARPPTSEEVQAKLAAHAESLRKQAQDAASMLNLPSYLNPSVVNPHQYAVQAQKRKLLWSGKKTTEVCITSPPPPPTRPYYPGGIWKWKCHSENARRKRKRKADVFKFLRFEERFQKLRFRNGLVWTVGKAALWDFSGVVCVLPQCHGTVIILVGSQKNAF